MFASRARAEERSPGFKGKAAPPASKPAGPLHEAVLTFDDALAWAKAHPACQGFTYQSADRRPSKPTRVWFKSRLRVLHADGWYTYSVGKQ